MPEPTEACHSILEISMQLRLVIREILRQVVRLLLDEIMKNIRVFCMQCMHKYGPHSNITIASHVSTKSAKQVGMHKRIYLRDNPNWQEILNEMFSNTSLDTQKSMDSRDPLNTSLNATTTANQSSLDLSQSILKPNSQPLVQSPSFTQSPTFTRLNPSPPVQSLSLESMNSPSRALSTSTTSSFISPPFKSLISPTGPPSINPPKGGRGKVRVYIYRYPETLAHFLNDCKTNAPLMTMIHNALLKIVLYSLSAFSKKPEQEQETPRSTHVHVVNNQDHETDRQFQRGVTYNVKFDATRMGVVSKVQRGGAVHNEQFDLAL